MIFLVWICLDLVYQLEFFTIWYKKAIYMCFGFSIFDFFRFFYAYLNLGQILGLNKFKTWKWNGKHESFLTHSKMKVLENFMFETQNPSSLHMFDFIRQSLARVRGRYIWYIHDISALNMSRDRPCLSTWMLTIWHKIKAIYICALVFHFFLNFSEFLLPFESWSNPRFDQG
jgi:hypothetical protein